MESVPPFTSLGTEHSRTSGVNVKEEEGSVRIKEEEIPVEISTGTEDSRTSGVNVKEEEGNLRIKEEEIPVEISTDYGDSPAQIYFKAEEEEMAMGTKEEEIGTEIMADYGNSTAQIDVKAEEEEMGIKEEEMGIKEEEMAMGMKEEDIGTEVMADGQDSGIHHDQPMGGVKQEAPTLPLTREEKLKILQQKMREKNGQALDWGPSFPSNPVRDPNNPGHAPDPDPHKIGHSDWCSCGNCISMPTGLESICCMEIPSMKRHLRCIPCITSHKYFPYLCVNPDLVRVYRDMFEVRSTNPKDKDKNRFLRKAAYRAFSVWIHGHLRKVGRRPIPACVVHKVRTAFLDPGKPCDDYAAEYMVFH